MAVNNGDDIKGLQPAVLAGKTHDALVHSNYSKIGEQFRHFAPPELQCSVFCGGRRCKYDSSKYWPDSQMAIDGIYSHWVTDKILAMARPNTDVIQSKNIISQFLENNIRTIINLQLPGEHASCGGPLCDSGFSYDPNVFMDQGIFYYNFALRDHSEPTLTGILDMVKVMAFALSEGKVAVHCHAGLGRTGVLIACYLIYALRVRANDAIRYVRLKRPNAVQTSAQIEIVQEFEAYILPQLYVFCNKDFIRDKKNTEFTLQKYLHKQQTVLHGYEARALKHIPKIIYIICERLLKLCGCEGSTTQPHVLAPLEISYTIGTPAFTSYFLSAQFDHESSKVSYSAPLSIGSPSFYSNLSGSRTAIESHDGICISPPNKPSSLFDADLRSMIVNPEETNNIHAESASLHEFPIENEIEVPPLSGGQQTSEEDSGFTGGEDFLEGDVSMPNSAVYQTRRFTQQCKSPDVPSCVSGIPDQNVDHLLDDGIKNQTLTDNLCYQELTSHDDLKEQVKKEQLKVVLPKEVYESLLVDHSLLNVEFKKLVKSYRVDLNNKQSSWDRLKTESNLHALTGLLFSWLEHLKQPVLTVDSLSFIVLTSHKPEVCLRKLDKEIRYTVEYLTRFISRLQPLTREQREDLLKRLIASLTQQSVPVRESLLPAVLDLSTKPNKGAKEKKKPRRNGFSKLREGTLRKCIEFMTKFYDSVNMENRSYSAASANSSVSTAACVTPPGQINVPHPEEEIQEMEVE